MRLSSVSIENYRSILNSGEIPIEDDITVLVGKSDSGKTAFLKMLEAADMSKVINESDITKKSPAHEKMLNNQINKDKLLLMTANFVVEDNERQKLPERLRRIKEISLKRYMDRVEISYDGVRASKNHINEYRKIFENIYTKFDKQYKMSRDRILLNIPDKQRKLYDQGMKESWVTATSKMNRLEEVEFAFSIFLNYINTIPSDDEFRQIVAETTLELDRAKENFTKSLLEDADEMLYKLIPKPQYNFDVFEIRGSIPIDEFIGNPSGDDTFRCIAILTLLNPDGLQNIRHKGDDDQKSYLERCTDRLNRRISGFWKQNGYTYSLGITGENLEINVTDDATGIITNIEARSTGFKWWTALFLRIASLNNDANKREILMLDSPASQLHDAARGDVQRFLRDMASECRLQIIYATHERALVDTWNVKQIRLVEKNDEKGTMIRRAAGGHDNTLLKIRAAIGSPARYSLVGAPRTILFEGNTDTVLFGVFNDYMERCGMKEALERDLHTVACCDGAGNMLAFYSAYQALEIKTVIVTDSGKETDTKFQEHRDARHVGMKDVLGRSECDIEDMIASSIYHAAVCSAYPDLNIPKPDSPSSDKKKQINRYKDLFSKCDYGYFNKTHVNGCLADMIMDKEKREALDSKEFEMTLRNFKKLNGMIRSAFK